MTRKDGYAVKDSFGGRVRLRQLKPDAVRIQLLNANRLAGDDQQVALRSIDLFVEIDLETEDHIVRIEGLAVREMQTAAKLQRILPAILRNLPRLRQGRLRLLRSAINVNQVSRKASNDFTRSLVKGENRIERLWLRPQSHGKPAACVARRVVRNHQVPSGFRSPRRNSSYQREESCGDGPCAKTFLRAGRPHIPLLANINPFS